jgi:hypothetical protein
LLDQASSIRSRFFAPDPRDGGRDIVVDDLDGARTSSAVITDAKTPVKMQA